MTPQKLEDELREIVASLSVDHARANAICHLSAEGVAHAREIGLVASIRLSLTESAVRLERLLQDMNDEPFQHESEVIR